MSTLSGTVAVVVALTWVAGFSGCAPLWVMVTCVCVLLVAGAKLNAKDSDGWTALMYAARDGRAGITKILLDSGADSGAKNSLGKTASMLAVERAHTDITELLENKN